MSHQPTDTPPPEKLVEPPALRREVMYTIADPRKFGAVAAVASMAGVAIGFALAMLAQPVHLCGVSRVVEMQAPAVTATATSEIPWLGVQVESALGERGALVESTFPQTPAETAGLRAGDILIGIDHVPVSTAPGLVRAIRSHRVGDGVDLVFLRRGQQHVVRAVLAGIGESDIRDLQRRR